MGRDKLNPPDFTTLYFKEVVIFKAVKKGKRTAFMKILLK